MAEERNRNRLAGSRDTSNDGKRRRKPGPRPSRPSLFGFVARPPDGTLSSLLVWWNVASANGPSRADSESPGSYDSYDAGHRWRKQICCVGNKHKEHEPEPVPDASGKHHRHHLELPLPLNPPRNLICPCIPNLIDPGIGRT